MQPRAAAAKDFDVSKPPPPQGAQNGSQPGIEGGRQVGNDGAGPVAGEGGRERLRKMFNEHHHVVWRTLCRYGLDPDAAADVGQQAYVVALERIEDIWPGSERAFLVGTALRLARKHRHKAARTRLETTIEERAHTPGRAESHAITLELLDRVLAQLDEGLVEIFVLFDVEGFSTKEVASALDVPEGTVASRLRRAREAFRAATRRLDHVSKREEGGR